MVMMTTMVVPAVVVSAVVMSPAVAASIMAAVVPASISTTAPSIPAAVGLSKNRSGQPEHRKDEQYRFYRHVDSCPVSTSVTYLTHHLLPLSLTARPPFQLQSTNPYSPALFGRP
jgi:hypothetical protein